MQICVICSLNVVSGELGIGTLRLRHVAQNDAWLCTKPNCFALEDGSHIICLRFRTFSVIERALRILVDISCR
jgi:hypothetical protein